MHPVNTPPSPAFPLMTSAQVASIAKQMGVSYDDAVHFLLCIALWMDRGHSFNSAVGMHMRAMRDGCELLAKQHGIALPESRP